MLTNRRVFFAGRLAAMTKRDAHGLVRQRGGTPVAKFDDEVNWIIVGELQTPGQVPLESLDEPLQQAVQQGQAELSSEREFLTALGLTDAADDVHRLYTLAMMAELFAIPLAEIRRWHRRGWLQATKEVRRLAYFDFPEVTIARLLAELVQAGATPTSIDRELAALAHPYPQVRRPLAELPLRVEGKHLLLREGASLIEPSGQRRFDFDAPPANDLTAPETPPPLVAPLEVPPQVAELLDAAAEWDEQGHLSTAADHYRAALAAGGPKAEVNFLLADVLYRLGDRSAARERYYMAVEMDENYVEARANLGCLLAEMGQTDLAVAAFEGALAYHPDYPDAHYHLARTLDELNRSGDAEQHWQAFLLLAPDSPWADEAVQRLGWDDHEAAAE